MILPPQIGSLNVLNSSGSVEVIAFAIDDGKINAKHVESVSTGLSR
jgi:hypothetical protein